jgi:hypothetical protein
MPGGVATAWVGTIISGALIATTFIPVLPSFMGKVGVSIFVGWAILGLLFYLASSGYRNAVTEEERVATIFQKKA